MNGEKMPARYVVVQYLPDPVKDERINIGVLAFDADGVECRFLHDWSRVHCFANRSIGFLQEITVEMQRACGVQRTLDRITDDRRITPASIVEMSGKWSNCIQFTPPRGSIRSRTDLVQEIAKRFLTEHIRPDRAPFRNRNSARSLVVKGVQSVMDEVLTETLGSQLIKKNAPVKGAVDHYSFDVAVSGDGSLPYFIMHGISMEGPGSKDRSEALDAFKWGLTDVLNVPDMAPVNVMILKPKENFTEYRHFKRVIEGIGANVIDEDKINTVVAKLITNTLPDNYMQAAKRERSLLNR